MLAWPHSASDWASNLAAVEPAFIQIASAISARENLLLLCFDDAHRQHIEKQLRTYAIPMNPIRMIIAPCNDTWARDFAPITIIREQNPILLNFTFNGWGDKYNAELDNAINRKLHDAGHFLIQMEDIPLVLEGGSIESDGQGTLLTTRQCLLSDTRNPDLSEIMLERALKKHLGIERILWLHYGALQGDDTDSHIDNLARFINADTIAYLHCDYPSDPHYKPLQQMEAELKTFKTASGVPYTLLPLPLPKPIHDKDHRRLPASYINFLIINGAVLLPFFKTEEDKIAQEKLQRAFPQRQIIGIDCREIIRQNGGIHCLTMQFPAGVLPHSSLKNTA